jgi:hypothetical protein
MKPYLINSCTETPLFNRYLKTIDPYKGQFEHLLVTFKEYPGNVERFFYIPELFKDTDWCIFIDTNDVIMQTDLPDLSHSKGSIIIANENEIHENSFWKSHVQKGMFKRLAKKTIYNGGSFAMKGKMFKEFIKFLEKMRAKNNSPFLDQLALNYFCHILHNKETVEHPTLFTTLYANMDKGIVIKIGSHWVNTRREPFTFVHGNGTFKKFL